MDLIKELNEAADKPCAKYFDDSRLNDFAKAIKELMDDGKSYGDAKAEVFDEDSVPPSGSACCKKLDAAVKALK